MQLVEVSVSGVRSAAITLQAPGTAMRFILFPMLHLGSVDYYESVSKHLGSCDLIVSEGILGRSLSGSALTLAYRLPARRGRLALTVQDIDFAALGIPLIRPDMTAPQFHEGWRSVPVLCRLAVWCLAPLFGLSFALLGTRRTLSLHVGTEDLPDPAEAHAMQLFPRLTELILDHRDTLLADCLASIHDEYHDRKFDVAVVYGARHMRAVTRELYRLFGYRPREAEWLTVFEF